MCETSCELVRGCTSDENVAVNSSREETSFTIAAAVEAGKSLLLLSSRR